MPLSYCCSSHCCVVVVVDSERPLSSVPHAVLAYRRPTLGRCAHFARQPYVSTPSITIKHNQSNKRTQNKRRPKQRSEQTTAIISLESFHGHAGHNIGHDEESRAEFVISYNRNADVWVNYFYGAFYLLSFVCVCVRIDVDCGL